MRVSKIQNLANKKHFYKMTIFLSLIFSSFICFAEAPTKETPKEAYEYSEMAKSRNYIGGSEESDLKLLPENFFQKNKTTMPTEETSEGF